MDSGHSAEIEYQAVGEPITGVVACQDCFALVVSGDRQWHTEWHQRAKRAAMGFPLGRTFGGL